MEWILSNLGVIVDLAVIAFFAAFFATVATKIYARDEKAHQAKRLQLKQ